MDLESAAGLRYLVIGDPVGHSRSPEMQNAGFEAAGLGRPYGKLRVAAEELPAFAEFARRRLDGFNITVPHKERIAPLLDERDPVAELAGSFNTVSCRDGRLIGTSTDGCGLEQAVREAFQVDVAGSAVLLVGTGGAARAAAFHFAAQGAACLRFANRTVARAEELAARVGAAFPGVETAFLALDDRAALREAIAASELLIQATSLGLREDDPPPFPPDLLTANARICCFDTIYRPTPLLRAAARMGVRAADGRWMLLHQGAKSWSIWTGRPAPVEAMRAALDRSLR